MKGGAVKYENSVGAGLSPERRTRQIVTTASPTPWTHAGRRARWPWRSPLLRRRLRPLRPAARRLGSGVWRVRQGHGGGRPHPPGRLHSSVRAPLWAVRSSAGAATRPELLSLW